MMNFPFDTSLKLTDVGWSGRAGYEVWVLLQFATPDDNNRNRARRWGTCVLSGIVRLNICIYASEMRRKHLQMKL